ncbi:C-type lectin domain family 2 member B-like isoform 2-T3 [Chlamydotis macqueenii]
MAEAAQDAGEDAAAVMMPSQQRAEGETMKKCPACPSCPSPAVRSCPENGIGFGEKCFYFVEAEADWNRSQASCLSLGAHLAAIDSQEELSFLLRYGRSWHYWVGLRREGSAPWRWSNGSLFNNAFPVRGNGQCAYINLDGISSDWCSQVKSSVCSHPQKRLSRIRRSRISPGVSPSAEERNQRSRDASRQ